MRDWTVEAASLGEIGQEWDALHRRTSSPLFSSSRWLSILADIHGREARCAVLREGTRLRAGIPLLMKRRGMLRYSSPLPITLYSGLLHDLTDAELTSELPQLSGLVERSCHFAVLSLADYPLVSSTLAKRGWDLTPRITLRLDITDTELLWNKFSQSVRRKIRRASEQQLRFAAHVDPVVITDMYERSYIRHGLHPPITPEVVRRWLQELVREGIAETFAAFRPDGAPAAARACIRDGDTVYDWLAGADVGVSPSASHWLMHTLLCRYSEQGATVLDFMGGNTPGVADFKRSFGSTEAGYTEAHWYRSSLVKALLRINASRLTARRKV